MSTDTDKTPVEGAQWWRYGHIWLVFGLPFVVVLASFATLYIAASNPETIISTAPEHLSKENAAYAPAHSARNHAQTGGVPDAQ